MKKKVLVMMEFECKDDTEFREQYENLFKILEENGYTITDFLEK